jgi:hypothetical protein
MVGVPNIKKVECESRRKRGIKVENEFSQDWDEIDHYIVVIEVVYNRQRRPSIKK